MTSSTPGEEASVRVREQAAHRAQVDLFVRAAAGTTGAFGVLILVLGLGYEGPRRLVMSAMLCACCGGLLVCRQMANRGHVERAAVTTAVLTLVGTVALAIVHPGIHAALVMAALVPAVSLQFAPGRAQLALLLLSWVATICVGLAAELVIPSTPAPESVPWPLRLLAIAAASGVFMMLLWRNAGRLFQRIDEARAGQAAAAAATAALSAEHERLSVTLASIGEAVIVTDSEGRVTLMNGHTARLVGADLQGRPVREVGRFEDAHGQTIDPVSAVLRDGGALESSEPMVLARDDGQRFHVYVSASPIRTNAGALVGSVIVLRDVSERVRLEGELREAQRLDAIGRLAGGVAHDFNNQLTSILGYTELLSWSFDESDQRRHDMEEIRKAADRAALVTQQLLAFSRRQILQPHVVHVPDVVKRSARLLCRMLPEHITVDTAIEPNLEPVFVDPHQLGHVLLNLAVSARDAMPDGGRLTIRAANVRVAPGVTTHHDLPPGSWVQLTVEDTGTVIPVERLPRVFEPFANQTRTSTGSLALAVAHGIVVQSGGRIHVRSDVGRGNTFTMHFAAARTAAEPGAREAQPVGGHESLLLVEDDAAVRALLASTLERQGYAVTAVRGHDEAVAAIPWAMHGLIVDLDMADGRAIPLAAKVLARTPSLPIVYVSGREETELVRASRPPGRLLQKPFTPRDLLVAVRETLDQARPGAVGAATPRG